MRTIWHSLVWKEWHEHKWKLVSLTAILWSIASLGLFDPERGTLIGTHVALVMAIVPLAIFIGLGSAAGERSRGTLAFLQSLPVPMWRVALHKVAIGLATIIVPALLTVAFVFVWLKLGGLLGVDFYPLVAEVNKDFRKDAPFVLVEHWYANSALTLTLVASGFYFWTIAAGVNRKDEVSAGAVALTVIMAWCVILLCVWNVYWNWYFAFSRWPVAAKWLAVAGVATAPGGLVTLDDAIDGESHYLLPAACVTGVTMLLLAAWYVRRFGRILNVEIRSPKAAEVAAGRLDWLGPPRRSPFTAVAWKQFRESGPLALVGVAVVLAVCTAIFIVDAPLYRGDDDYGRFLELFAAVSFTIGIAVTMIVGIGVFLYDIGPGLATFWRSRPINSDLWFWTKFLSGLAIILAAIYGPVFLIALPRVNLSESVLLVFPAITVAVFAAAAAMTCLVRNAVYAAILSIAVVYLGFVATSFSVAGARILRSGQWPETFGDVFIHVSAPQAGAGMLFTFLVCTLAAWLAVRNDWGQKSRY